MLHCDLNCDMGEGIGNDEAIMPYISSANIACGYHAGDEETMRQTIALAIKNGIKTGAHPGFKDKANFGRIEMALTSNELYQIVYDQISLLDRIASEYNATLHHVKPHGALYNMAAKDPNVAKVIADAVKAINKELILVGLSGSHLIKEAKNAGLNTGSEVFADRTYQDDGSLTPRSNSNALIEDENHANHQVLQMVKDGFVTSVSGKLVPIKADTICIHGDGAFAVQFARSINKKLTEEKIIIGY